MNDAEMVQSALARLVQAERSPAQLMGVKPEVLEGLYAIGLDARAKGRSDLAERAFQRCVMLDPFRADFWVALASARQALGRSDEAGELYQVAGLLTEDPAPVAYAAACFAQAGQTERAALLAEYVRTRTHRDDLEAWLRVAESREVAP